MYTGATQQVPKIDPEDENKKWCTRQSPVEDQNHEQLKTT